MFQRSATSRLSADISSRVIRKRTQMSVTIASSMEVQSKRGQRTNSAGVPRIEAVHQRLEA